MYFGYLEYGYIKSGEKREKLARVYRYTLHVKPNFTFLGSVYFDGRFGWLLVGKGSFHFLFLLILPCLFIFSSLPVSVLFLFLYKMFSRPDISINITLLLLLLWSFALLAECVRIYMCASYKHVRTNSICRLVSGGKIWKHINKEDEGRQYIEK